MLLSAFLFLLFFTLTCMKQQSEDTDDSSLLTTLHDSLLHSVNTNKHSDSPSSSPNPDSSSDSNENSNSNRLLWNPATDSHPDGYEHTYKLPTLSDTQLHNLMNVRFSKKDVNDLSHLLRLEQAIKNFARKGPHVPRKKASHSAVHSMSGGKDGEMSEDGSKVLASVNRLSKKLELILGKTCSTATGDDVEKDAKSTPSANDKNSEKVRDRNGQQPCVVQTKVVTLKHFIFHTTDVQPVNEDTDTETITTTLETATPLTATVTVTKEDIRTERVTVVSTKTERTTVASTVYKTATVASTSKPTAFVYVSSDSAGKQQQSKSKQQSESKAKQQTESKAKQQTESKAKVPVPVKASTKNEPKGNRNNNEDNVVVTLVSSSSSSSSK